jgi:hypothetical protein
MAAIDPSEYTVEAVKAWVKDNWHDHRNDATFVSVHDAERDGSARVSLLDWLDHFAEDHEIDVTPQATGGPITLNPTTGVYGSAPILLTVTGTGFTSESGIAFDGGSKVTTFVNATTLTTIIDWTLIKGAGEYVCWVVTAGVSTDPATFTVTPAPPTGPQPSTPDDVLTLQLRSWGITGEPVTWAINRWQPVITAIRFANLGFGTQATVQGLLDSVFPLNHIQASAVCLPATLRDPDPKVTKVGERFRLRAESQGLPDENIAWLIDNVMVGNGPQREDVEMTPFKHTVAVHIAAAGVVITKTVEFDASS